MIWSKTETMSRKEIEEIQLSRLKETVSYIYERVPAYKRKWTKLEFAQSIFKH